MQTIITRNDPRITKVDGRVPETYATEASTLQLPVGSFPRQISTLMGNGLPFILASVDGFGTAWYVQQFGCISLKVFND